MELKEALLKRRSVRKFTEEAVSEEMIQELLHAAMSGPSASKCYLYWSSCGRAGSKRSV